MSAGYFTFPTVHNDTVVFVSEDDLWSVPLSGGLARRLTTRSGYTAKEEPQPQVLVALGFEKTKPFPLRPPS